MAWHRCRARAGGAIAAWGDAGGTWVGGTLKALAKRFGFALDTPWRKLPAKIRDLLLYGSGDEKVRFEFRTTKGSAFIHTSKFEGVIPSLERRYKQTSSENVRRGIAALAFEGPKRTIADPIVREIAGRLGFLEGVGLGYLTLDRSAGSLAG